MKTRQWSGRITVCGAVALSGMADAQPLITNGSFETGDFSGWRRSTPDSDFSAITLGTGFDGYYVANLATLTRGSLGHTLTQSVNAIDGQAYDLSFMLRAGNSFSNYFDVYFDGALVHSYANSDAELGSGVDRPIVRLTLPVTANAGSSDLMFVFKEAGMSWWLDDVRLEPASAVAGPPMLSAVPEPSAAAFLLVGGAGVIGWTMRRRRSRPGA